MSEFWKGFLVCLGFVTAIELLAAAAIVAVLRARRKPKTLDELFGRKG